MIGLSEVFVLPPSDLFLGVLFHYIESEPMFVKYFELFKSENPDEFIYNLSQLMVLIRIVTIVLGNSDPSTTEIVIFFCLIFFSTTL